MADELIPIEIQVGTAENVEQTRQLASATQALADELEAAGMGFTDLEKAHRASTAAAFAGNQAYNKQTEEIKKLEGEVKKLQELSLELSRGQGVVVGAVKASSESAKEAKQSFGQFKQEFKDFVQMGEQASGTSLGLSRIISSAVNPAFLAGAIAAAAFGAVVKGAKEEAAAHEELMATYHASLIAEAEILLKIRDAHGLLNAKQKETIALAAAAKSAEWSKEYNKLSDDVNNAADVVNLLNKGILDQDYKFQAVQHPVAAYRAIVATLTGNEESLRKGLDEANAALKRKADETETGRKALKDYADQNDRLQKLLLNNVNPALLTAATDIGILNLAMATGTITAGQFLTAMAGVAKAAAGSAKTASKEFKNMMDAEVVSTKTGIDKIIAEYDGKAKKIIELGKKEHKSQKDINAAVLLLEDIKQKKVKAYMDDLIKDNEKKNAAIALSNDRAFKAWETEQNKEIKSQIAFFTKTENMKELATKKGLAKRLAALKQEQTAEREATQAHGEAIGMLQERIDEQLTEIDKVYAEERIRMAKEEHDAKVQYGYSQAGALVAAAGGVFKNNKALSYAGAIIDMLQAIAKANAMGLPQSIPAMAFAAAIGALQIAGIATAKEPTMEEPKGQFHGGGMIPSDGTYYMKANEVVVPPDMNSIIGAINKTGKAAKGGGGGATHIHYHGHVFAQQDADRQIAQANVRGKRQYGIGSRR